jgi:hypothetical protein
MPKWFGPIKNQILFYAVFFLGAALFSGLRTSLLATVLILFLNAFSRRLVGHLSGRLGTTALLVVQSLVSLGLFPFLWLASVLAAGAAYPWVLCLFLPLLAVFGLAGKKSPAASNSTPALALVLILLLVLAATYLPFSHIGKPQPQGLAYRAYFSSDYLKHFSVVEAINHGKLPPANPYFEGEALHYYWLGYAVPALLAKLGGSVPRAMFAWSFMVNFLFLALLVVTVREIGVRRRLLPYFLTAAALTTSLEGLYFFVYKSGSNFEKFLVLGSEYNIDALTRWLWNLPQIDTLLRSMLYTPQHLMAVSLLLVFSLSVLLDPNKPLFLSALIAATLAASFFIGGILLFAWMASFLIRETRLLLRRKTKVLSTLGRALTSFLLPWLAVALFQVLSMSEFGWRSEFFLQKLTPAQAALLLFLNIGVLLLTGLAGCVLVRFPARLFHLILFWLALLLILFVRIRNFENDLSLKLGLVLVIELLIFTAFLFEKFGLRGLPALFLIMLLVLPGTATLFLDIRNSADIANKRFTFYLPVEEKAVLDWVRLNTPAAAVVQTFPPAREWNVSIVPPFAARDMFVGDSLHGRIFQIGEEKYTARLDILKRCLQNLPASGPELKGMGLDYLFWGKPEFRYFGYYPPLKRAFAYQDTVLFALE